MAPRGALHRFLAAAAVAVAAFVAELMAGGGTSAQPSGGSCDSVLLTLAPCLGYIAGDDPVPSGGCCAQLASVAQSGTQCLCQLGDGGGGLTPPGIAVNQTSVAALLAECNIQDSQNSPCNANQWPSDTSAPPPPPPPSHAHSSPPYSPYAYPSPPDGKGLKALPLGSVKASAANSCKTHLLLVFIFVSFVSYHSSTGF